MYFFYDYFLIRLNCDKQSESAQGEAAANAMAGRGGPAFRGRGGRGMRRR